VFNIGAAASRIAAAVSRATEEGVRAACGEFQRAAGAFRAVGEMMEEEEATTVDMGSQASAMLERLMLAQAQECCFERALAAGKSPPVCSKVARQVRFYCLHALFLYIPLVMSLLGVNCSAVCTTSEIKFFAKCRNALLTVYDYSLIKV